MVQAVERIILLEAFEEESDAKFESFVHGLQLVALVQR